MAAVLTDVKSLPKAPSQSIHQNRFYMAQQKKLLLTGLYSFVIIGSASFYAMQKDDFDTNGVTNKIAPINMAKGKPIDANPHIIAAKINTIKGQEVAIE